MITVALPPTVHQVSPRQRQEGGGWDATLHMKHQKPKHIPPPSLLPRWAAVRGAEAGREVSAIVSAVTCVLQSPKPANIWGPPRAKQRCDALASAPVSPTTQPACVISKSSQPMKRCPFPCHVLLSITLPPNRVLLSFPRAPRRMLTLPTPPSSSPPAASHRAAPGGTVLS